MNIASLDFKLKDYEIAAYELSKYYIKKGLVTDVMKYQDGYKVYISKTSFMVSSVAVKVIYREVENGTEVEVALTKIKWNASKVIDETISTITIIPLFSKFYIYNRLKKDVKKNAIKIACLNRR